MRRFRIFSLVLLLLSCARREFIRPPGSDEIVDSILGAFEEAEELHSLKAFGSLTGTEGGKGYWANFVLLYKKPGLLRLDLTGAFGMALMNMVADGGRVRVYYPHTGELFELQLSAFLSLDLEPKEVEKLILGTVEPPPGIHRAFLFSQGGSWVLEDPNGLWEMELAKGDMRLRRYLSETQEGSPLEIRLSRYRRVDGLLRPFSIEISEPEKRRRLKFDCTRQLVNEELDSNWFKLRQEGP